MVFVICWFYVVYNDNFILYVLRNPPFLFLWKVRRIARSVWLGFATLYSAIFRFAVSSSRRLLFSFTTFAASISAFQSAVLFAMEGWVLSFVWFSFSNACISSSQFVSSDSCVVLPVDLYSSVSHGFSWETQLPPPLFFFLLLFCFLLRVRFGLVILYTHPRKNWLSAPNNIE